VYAPRALNERSLVGDFLNDSAGLRRSSICAKLAATSQITAQEERVKIKLLEEELDRLWRQLQGGVPMISGGAPARVVRVRIHIPPVRK
jgi:hypothetical protein